MLLGRRLHRYRPARRHATVSACAAAAIVAAGCKDAGVDPLAEIVASETAGALALGVELPDPARWELPSDVDAEGAEAMLAWRGSWDVPTAEGRERREAAYDRLAAVHAARLARGGVADQLARLGEGVARARELPAEELPDHVRLRLGEAAAAYAVASRALQDERVTTALAFVLRGSDALREVGPEAVARTMVAEVETGLRRLSGDDSYSERDLERLERLVGGGRQAVEEGDWVRAIRRAYYARGLLNPGG